MSGPPWTAPGGGELLPNQAVSLIGTWRPVTLRHAGRLCHIGVGRPHAGTHILLLAQDLNIRVIDAADP